MKKQGIEPLSIEQFSKLSVEEAYALVSMMAQEIRDRDEQIAELKEIARLRNARQYKPSTEQMQYLFPELEILAEAELIGAEEAKEKDHPASEGKSRDKARGKRNPSMLAAASPVYDVYHTDGAREGYGKDGMEYFLDGEAVIEKIACIPGRYIVERHHYPNYTAYTEEGGIVHEAGVRHPAEMIAAAPSFIAECIVSKYDDHIPLYRMEEILRRDGIRIPRQTLARWMIAEYGMLMPLEGIYEKTVYSFPFLNKDETGIQVLDVKGPGGKPSANGFMYITIGSGYDEETGGMRRLVLHEYIQGRSKEVLLDGYRRHGSRAGVMTDGLKQYGGIPRERHCICWVHAARGFKDVLKANGKEENALMIAGLIGALYGIEDRWRERLSSGEVDKEGFIIGRKREAEEKIAAIVDRCREISQEYPDKSGMGKAIGYVLTYSAGLYNYLDYAEATPDNNIAERQAKAFATGRKNWLFAQTVDGADASAFLLSLVESAKLNGLDPRGYVESVIEKAPCCRTEADWETLLPWNVDLASLKDRARERAAALPDPTRTKPYILTGCPHL